jgi:hypothetical protein
MYTYNETFRADTAMTALETPLVLFILKYTNAR